MPPNSSLVGRDTPHQLKHKSHTSVADLRRELELSRRLMLGYDRRVKNNVEWVQKHCPVTSIRAQLFCKRWSVEKLIVTLNRLMNNFMGAAFRKWRFVLALMRAQEKAEKYMKWKVVPSFSLM